MPDPQTTNLDLYQPARGSDVGTWDTPLNANSSQLDTVLGGVTSIALTNVNVSLSSAQYNCGFINLTGGLSGNIVLTFPTKGRSYFINNATTGAFTITATTGAGTTVVLPAGTVQIYNDATNIKLGNSNLTSSRFNSVVIQTFTGSGTYTPTTGMLFAIIECVGGGGGGGGSDGVDATHTIGGSGGGGGDYSMARVTAAAVGASKVVTIGAAGIAGTSVPAAGGNGGDTSVGVLCIGKGGTGGPLGSNSLMAPGGAGGVAGTGDLTIPGQAGGTGYWTATGEYTTANHGGNAGKGFGAGGAATAATNFAVGAVTGAAGSNYGGGGAGGLSIQSANNAGGGAGAAGVVVITEYVAT